MSPRMKRRLYTAMLHGVVVLLCLLGVIVGSSLENEKLPVIFFLILVLYVLTIRLNPLPRMILTRIIGRVTCRECGEVIDLTNTWSCHCGYMSWVPRSALAPCRNCSVIFEFIVCPRCSAAIYL